MTRPLILHIQSKTYWYNHGYVYEARALLESFFDESLTEKSRGMLCHSIGIIEQRQGNPEKALEFFNESLEIKEKLGDIAGKSKIINEIGIIYQSQGDYEKALNCFNESIEICEKLGDIAGKSRTIHNIGIIYQLQGDYEKALNCLNESLEIYEKLGDIAGVASTKGQTGKLYVDLKRYNEAFFCFIEAYAVFKRLESLFQKLAAKELLNVKNFLTEDYFKEGLRKAGISEDELENFGQGDENPLKSITMLALSGQDGAGEQLQTILDKFPEDVKATEEGKIIYAYINHLYALANADDKTAFIKSADKAMVEMMVGIVGEENMPE